MRTTLALVAVLAALHSPLFAQIHPGGVNVGGGYPLNSNNYGAGVYTLDKIQPVYTTVWNLSIPGQATYLPNYWRDARMNVDNRTCVYVTGPNTAATYTQTSGVFAFDASSKATQPIVQNAQDFYQGNGIEVTTDGDYIVVVQKSTPSDYHVLRLNPAGSYTTILPTTQVALDYAARRDVVSGDILIPSRANVGSAVNPVFAISANDSVRTFHGSSLGPLPTYGYEQNMRDGGFYYSTQSTLHRFTSGNAPTTQVANLGTILPVGFTAIGGVWENQTIKNPQLVMHVHSLSPVAGSRTWLCWFDPQQSWAVTKSVKHFTSTTFAKVLAYPNSDIFHDQNNYIQPVRTSRLNWTIQLNLPPFAGKSYVLLPTVSGHAPGFPLDARRVFLNWDAATNAAAANAIPTVFSQGPGQLGATGRATAKLDLSKLGVPTGLKFVVHLTLAVIDPAAPSGIGFVTEPVALQVTS